MKTGIRRRVTRKPSAKRSADTTARASETAATLIPAGAHTGGDEIARGIASLVASDRRSASWALWSADADRADASSDNAWAITVDADSDDRARRRATGRAPSRPWTQHAGPDRSPPPRAGMQDNARDAWSLHSELFRCIAALEKTMFAERSNLPLGLRNSNTPEPIARIPFDSKDRRAIDNAVAVLKAQPPQPASPPAEALAAAGKLQTIGERICTHFAMHVDTIAPEGTNTGALEYGKLLVVFPSWGMLACNLIAVAGAARYWIGSTSTDLS